MHPPSGPQTEVRESPVYVYFHSSGAPSTASVFTEVTWFPVQVNVRARPEIRLLIWERRSFV